MLSFPLISINVPSGYVNVFDIGLRMFVLNLVVWMLSRQFLGSTAPPGDMLMMAIMTVVGIFVYYLIVKKFLVRFYTTSSSDTV